MTELSKEEIELINKMAQSYWTENNRTHIDNEEEWNLTLNLVKKLTIPDVVSMCCNNPKEKHGHTAMYEHYKYCGNCGKDLL